MSLPVESFSGITQLSPGLLALWVWEAVLGQHWADNYLTTGPHPQPVGASLASGSHRRSSLAPGVDRPHGASQVTWRKRPSFSGPVARACSVPGSAGSKLLYDRGVRRFALTLGCSKAALRSLQRIWVSPQLLLHCCLLGSEAAQFMPKCPW